MNRPEVHYIWPPPSPTTYDTWEQIYARGSARRRATREVARKLASENRALVAAERARLAKIIRNEKLLARSVHRQSTSAANRPVVSTALREAQLAADRYAESLLRGEM